MKHQTHRLDRNSLKALKEELQIFSRRENEILGLLHTRNAPMTDREIMIALGYQDMNAVRPRLSELMDRLWIKKVCDTYDPVTKKSVRCVMARTAEERLKVIVELEQEENQLPLFNHAA
jgi:hypothetical protein